MSKQTVVSSTNDQGVELQTGKHTTWYKVQNYFNQLNHVLNGVVACFMTLYFIRECKDSFSWHVFLTTIGYQLLMTEAIMVFYAPNSWTYVHSYKTKKHLHWILQSIATIFIITGNVIISVIRTTPHFKTIHAVTGEFTSIFLHGNKQETSTMQKIYRASIQAWSRWCFWCCRHYKEFGLFTLLNWGQSWNQWPANFFTTLHLFCALSSAWSA